MLCENPRSERNRFRLVENTKRRCIAVLAELRKWVGGLSSAHCVELKSARFRCLDPDHITGARLSKEKGPLLPGPRSNGVITNDGSGAEPEAVDPERELPLSADSGHSPDDDWSAQIDP